MNERCVCKGEERELSESLYLGKKELLLVLPRSTRLASWPNDPQETTYVELLV